MIYCFTILLVILAACLTLADINMHNPRGSNNRQDESTRARTNANRLFNSQNNDRGGHNVGPFPGAMYYYAGSQLRINWANQHSCADENNNCQVVIQYMCDENLRDGTTTDRAPTTCADDCDTNEKYGHHESLNYYEACRRRERNKGLFIADRNLNNKNTAIYTRQNNNGARYGYECQEERDYYPYFGDSPWMDIAIMTNDQEVCNIIQANSQNVKSRWICTFSDDDWDELRGKILEDALTDPILYLDKDSCEAASITVNETASVTFQPVWKEIPSHNLDPPECVNEQFSRDNHQGNTIGGGFLEYIWTVPNIEAEHCAIRIRYNISTNDFPYWDTDHTKNVDRDNDQYGPEEVYEDYGFDDINGDVLTEVRQRQYYLKNNPNLDVFDTRSSGLRLRLALDTSQYGRTFQDRSHSFAIKPRPPGVPDSAKIYNLNVQGKRGNIVQVYPSVEYDFVPMSLNTNLMDYVHIQWTGSDNNPGNNNGEGARKTDRSNIVQLGPRPYAEGSLGSLLTLGTNYPPEYPCDHDLFGVNREQLTKLALAGEFEVGDTPGETLDDSDAYFDFGLLQTNAAGKHYFFSTRNNNFSNRDQKAQIITT